MSSYVCIVTQSIYGTSGDELPPPVEESKQYAYLSTEGESREDFGKRMAELVLPHRRKSDSEPKRPYSYRDGWGWAIYDLKPIPGESQ